MNLREKILTKFVELSRSQRFYAASLYLIPFWACSLLLPFETMTTSFLLGLVILGMMGVISDVLALYSKIWSYLLGKGAILVIYAMLTNFAFSLSSQAVNSIIGVEPTSLVYSISFVSILTIPILISLCTIVLLGALFLFGQFYMIFSIFAKDLKKIPALAPFFPEKSEPYTIITLVVRFVYFGVTLSLLLILLINFFPTYDKFVTSRASAFIYNFEAYSSSRCELEDNEKAIPINDSELVKVRKLSEENYKFELQRCIPRISPNK